MKDKNNIRRLLAVLLFAAVNVPAALAGGHRTDMLINEGWGIKPVSNALRGAKTQPVVLPHTWNAEYTDGKQSYNRENQKFNHPSVCFWGLFNELLISDGGKFTEYDNPVEFVAELNRLCHETDPSRLPSCTSAQSVSHPAAMPSPT